MTLDLDLVVRFDDEATLNALIHSLRDEFFIDAESVHSSIRSNQMFQALDNETYITIDFHVGERIPGELERSVPTEIFPGITVPFASIEDSLLSKLIWYSMGSERSWQDALYIVHRQRRKLDVQLLTQLAESLDLSRELSRLLDAGERDL
jgi:hypothetical protein